MIFFLKLRGIILFCYLIICNPQNLNMKTSCCMSAENLTLLFLPRGSKTEIDFAVNERLVGTRFSR